MNTRKLRGSAASLLGGLLVMSTTALAHAQGTIVYHSSPDVRVFPEGSPFPARHDMDLDGNGTVDFTFQAYSDFRVFSSVGGRSVGVPVGGMDIGSWSIPLLEGSSIGPELSDSLEWVTSFQPIFPPDTWIGAWLHGRYSDGSIGYWVPPFMERMTAFVGVEFAIGENVHYGWIRVSTITPSENGGIIHDWAYNSIPNMPILAGQVPEPGTWALLLGGGVALFVWRLGRKM